MLSPIAWCKLLLSRLHLPRFRPPVPHSMGARFLYILVILSLLLPNFANVVTPAAAEAARLGNLTTGPKSSPMSLITPTPTAPSTPAPQTTPGSTSQANASTLIFLPLVMRGGTLIGPGGGEVVGLDGQIQVGFPAGAVSEPVYVYVNRPAATQLPYSLSDNPFEILAEAADDSQAVQQFLAPLTVEVTYDEEQVPGDESSLTLFYYDERELEWVPLPTQVDMAGNRLTSQVDHLTLFDVNTRDWSAVPGYDWIIDQEADWIAASQLDLPGREADGAIPTYREPGMRSRVSPYFANYAALGLLERPKYASDVKRYMDWYFRHLNMPDYTGLYGTIYEYWVYPDGREEPRMEGGTNHPFYDSTDAYAGTFLALAKKYFEATGDAQYLIDHKDHIDLIGSVMVSTQEADGLTWARPDYKQKYLMDNSEVFMGFEAVEWIFRNVYRDESRANYFASRKNAVANGVQNKLWDPSTNTYRYHLDERDQGTLPDWTIFYVDATSQWFPVFSGLLAPTSQRSAHLYYTFSSYHSGWPALQASPDYAWAIIAYVGAIMGDRTRVDTFLNTVTWQVIYQGHPHNSCADKNKGRCWHTGEAGFTILAAQKIRDKAYNKTAMHLSNGEQFRLHQWPAQPDSVGPAVRWFIGDFNGDGKTDFAKFWNDSGAWSADVYRSTGRSFLLERWATRQGGFWDTQQWFTGDFNGDGKIDFAKYWGDQGQWMADVHLSTGHSFVMQNWAIHQGGFWDAQQWFTGDFNGDGKTDFAKVWGDNGAIMADVHLSTGSSFVMENWAIHQGGFSAAQKWFAGDFNGDGKTDLAKYWNDNGAWMADVHRSTGIKFVIENWAIRQGGFWDAQKWFTGDFNGDGKTDFAKYWNDNGTWWADVHRSTGTRFVIENWAIRQGGFWDAQKWFTGDFNGDGRTDFAKYWDGNGTWWADVHLAADRGFVMQNWAINQGRYYPKSLSGDFNGDGRTDVMLNFP